MIEELSGESFSDSSLISLNQTEENTINLDIKGLFKDKVWNKHKINSAIVAKYYADSSYKHFSQRINACSDSLEFYLDRNQKEETYRLKLLNTRFCRVRHCPVCQWRHSLAWKAKAYRVLPKVAQDYPKHRWLFLTLTVKNRTVEELRTSLNWMNKGFTRLTQLKAWPGEGWIKSTEVTRGENGSAHPHFHCLLIVPASYFSGQEYLSQARWTDLWQKCLRVDYKPITHVKAIPKHLDPQVIIPEILKYQVKESDLIADKGWFLELTTQLHRTRAVAVGGILRQYLRELEEEPNDLIREDTSIDKPDEASLFFSWEHYHKQYKLVH